MKTLKKTQMQPIEVETLSAYAEKFNTVMNYVAKRGKIIEHVTDLHLLKGYIIYEVTDHIPESLEDIFTLHRIKISCGQCANYNPTSFKNGECEHCRGKLRNDDYPCHKFWQAWEAGDCWLKEEEEKKYGEYESEFRCSRVFGYKWNNAQDHCGGLGPYKVRTLKHDEV